jgi:hypothetical protein
MLCILLFIGCCFSIGIYVPYLSLMMYVVGGTLRCLECEKVRKAHALSRLRRKRGSHRNLVVSIDFVCSKCILVQNVYLRKYV